MKKLVDRLDKELLFYEPELKQAIKYFGVSDDCKSLVEVADAANEKDREMGMDFLDRFSVVEF